MSFVISSQKYQEILKQKEEKKVADSVAKNERKRKREEDKQVREKNKRLCEKNKNAKK